MTSKEILTKAADLIKTAGWCQLQMHDDEYGTFCALGAILRVTDDPYIEREDTQAAIKALTKTIRHRVIADWNDDPKRTKKQVLSAFMKAAR